MSLADFSCNSVSCRWFLHNNPYIFTCPCLHSMLHSGLWLSIFHQYLFVELPHNHKIIEWEPHDIWKVSHGSPPQDLLLLEIALFIWDHRGDMVPTCSVLWCDAVIEFTYQDVLLYDGCDRVFQLSFIWDVFSYHNLPTNF